MTTYVFDAAWQQERDRLGALEALFDDASQRLMTAFPIRPGWRCLEVGAGAGGLARWLADQVGPSGHVLATDLDVRFLEGHDRTNLEVRRHDIVIDEFGEEPFDLIHARAVLEHLPSREDTLARLMAALRPGGYLLVEDVDFDEPAGALLARYVSPASAADAVHRVFVAVARLFGAAGPTPAMAGASQRSWPPPVWSMSRPRSTRPSSAAVRSLGAAAPSPSCLSAWSRPGWPVRLTSISSCPQPPARRRPTRRPSWSAPGGGDRRDRAGRRIGVARAKDEVNPS